MILHAGVRIVDVGNPIAGIEVDQERSVAHRNVARHPFLLSVVSWWTLVKASEARRSCQFTTRSRPLTEPGEARRR